MEQEKESGGCPVLTVSGNADTCIYAMHSESWEYIGELLHSTHFKLFCAVHMAVPAPVYLRITKRN